jgi:quinoprotein glucose dehydrogenase
MSRTLTLRAAALATAIVLAFSSSARAVEIEEDETTDTKATSGKIKDLGTRKAEADIAPASAEGEQAIKRMKVPAGLKISLWAAEPMLANPVAFNFDEKGRIFVAETYRYRSSVLDIRDYMWTLEDELANRTLEDQSAAILKHFGPDGVKELSIESERVRLLEDTDHTGVATKSYLYAEGFNSPLDGIASGVLARRGSVYFTNIPSVWKFSGDKKAEARKEISRGYGVRFNFTGHDLHGLAMGPDGKLYFSNGDRGAHAKGPDGSLADTPDYGAVYRCNPDGTQLEVFAYGLRNPQSLAFTENGDLFTGDNDCDKGDEERLVQVVENGDSGWRVGYQHPPLDKDTPWLADKLWQPRTKDTAAYLLSPICNIEDGPSGITYYPGTGLNESYRGSIFITHFKGSIARSGIYTYNVKPKGSGYAIADAKPFLTSALPTDVKFGPDGRLYTSDWADGWPKSKRGRIYAISDPAHEKDALVLETQKLIAHDWTKDSIEELSRLLGHPDQRVRQEAQFTFAERGSISLAPLTAAANKAASAPFARLHAIWGLGQLAQQDPKANALSVVQALSKLAKDSDAEVRAQSLKVIGDIRLTKSQGTPSGDVTTTAFGADLLIAALEDPAPRVKFFAAQSLGKFKHAAAAPALLAALATNADKDEYLRHALVMGLVGGNNVTAMTAAMASESRSVRLGVLLAFRRLGRAEVAKFLNDADPYVAREAVLAVNDAPIVAGYPALAALITKPSTDEGVMYRVLNAQFRLGQPENAAALAAYAANAQAPEKLRAEAITQLALWPTPPARDRVVGIFRPLAEKTRDASVAVKALLPILPGLLDAKASTVVQAAALKAVESLEIKSASDTLFAVVKDTQQPAANRAAALRALDKLKDARLAEAVKLTSDIKSPILRAATLPITARLSPESAAPVLASLVTSGTVAEQKTAFKALGTLQHPSAAKVLLEQLKDLAAGKVAGAIQLDLLNAAALRTEPEVMKALADREAQLAKSTDPLAAFQVTLRGGDKDRGQKIFNNQPVLACVRCHKIGTESGGEAGPNLVDVGSKYDRPYLLEAIVKPNAKIAPGFDTIVLTLKSGGAAAGIVASETADTITLRNTDNKLIEVKKANIAKRDSAPSGMPEIYGTILTKSEIRDVVEYLSTLRVRPGTGGQRGNNDDTKPRALRHLTAEQ